MNMVLSTRAREASPSTSPSPADLLLNILVLFPLFLFPYFLAPNISPILVSYFMTLEMSSNSYFCFPKISSPSSFTPPSPPPPPPQVLIMTLSKSEMHKMSKYGTFQNNAKCQFKTMIAHVFVD